MKKNYSRTLTQLLAGVILLSACKKNHDKADGPIDPNLAQAVTIDRFSATAGHLQVRNSTNGLPPAGQAVNFDQGPFITTGLSPTGQQVQYYNFDVQSTAPAPIWAFFKNGQQVNGQLNVVNVIPGDAGYNDFWRVYKVSVPDNYVANTITSYQQLMASGYQIERTDDLVNCPIVPNGSTATKGLDGGDAGLVRGWYNGMLVYYFNFFERPLSVTASGGVPLAPIYVSFNINPTQANGGPDSGFKTESATSPQTHNVLGAVPSETGYSPLWTVKVYDNASFASVLNLTTAVAAPLLAPNAGSVNCPVVSIQ
jgi:hypothetical protein